MDRDTGLYCARSVPCQDCSSADERRHSSPRLPPIEYGSSDAANAENKSVEKIASSLAICLLIGVLLGAFFGHFMWPTH